MELLPDPATEGAVQDVWRRLLDLGLPSQATHRHPTNRPHLTLATADALTPEVRGRLRRELAVLPLPLHLEGLVRFGRPGHSPPRDPLGARLSPFRLLPHGFAPWQTAASQDA